MKIIYVSHSTNYYGANKQLIELILHLRERYNIEPYVICRAECEFTKILSEKRIKYFVFPFYIWASKNIQKNLKDIIKQILNRFILFPYITRKIPKDVDLVHTNSSITNLGAYISQKFHVPHIWHVREYGVEDYELRYILNMEKVKKVFERAATIIAISKSIEEYYSIKICPDGKYALVYDGINPFVCKSKDLEFFKQDILKFCCVGLIQENKNQFEILEAAKILLEHQIYNFRIYFIGNGEEKYIRKMTMFVKENNLDEHVVFMGKQEKIGQILSEIHAGIMPSKREAFGRVTVEYMYAEMPVICSECGANKELIEQNKQGLFYTLYDSEELAGMMRMLIENRELAWNMGQNGRKKAEANFLIEQAAQKTYDLYQKILKGENK